MPAYVRISISTYIAYWQALLFTYRIGLHQVTPLCVVFLFMLVNWWVEKHQRFLFNVYKRFFYIFVTFFLHFLTFFIFLWNIFFTSMDEIWCDKRWKPWLWCVSSTLPSQEGALDPSSHRICGTSCTYARTQYEKQQPNFAWSSNCTWGKFLYGPPRMLTRDLFAVAIT